MIQLSSHLRRRSQSTVSVLCDVFMLSGVLAVSLFVFSILMIERASGQSRKDKLYIDDGSGLFTILKSCGVSSGSNTIWIPRADGMTVALVDPYSDWQAFDQGDLVYAGADGSVLSRLAAGSDGTVLTMNDGVPVWRAMDGSTITNVNAVSLNGESNSDLHAAGMLTGTLGIAHGGTGANTASTALTGLLPAQSSNEGRVLKTDGSEATWQPILSDFSESLHIMALNSVVPVVQFLATNPATDVDIAITPKGNGAVTTQVADGLASGGNKRGVNAVDLQLIRADPENVASGVNSTLTGGYGNAAAGAYSFVGGGVRNAASANYSTVAGGALNSADAVASTVSGGYANIVSGANSSISGGRGLTLTGYGSQGFLGNNFGSNDMTVDAPNTTVIGNTDLWLANNDDDAHALYFYAPNSTTGSFPGGTNFVGFRAGAVTTSVIWTLPGSDGTSGQVLQTDGLGTLSWASAGGTGSLTAFTESTNEASPNDIIPTDQLLATNSANDVDVAITPKGNGALTTQIADGTLIGGNKRGTNAIDLQLSRDEAVEVASGSYSTLSGGQGNMASNPYTTVSGGLWNGAFGDYAFTGGGYTNATIGNYSVVVGGNSNNAYGVGSFVGGGGFDGTRLAGNNVYGNASTICGGIGNFLAGDYSIILGGNTLWLMGSGSVGFIGNNPTGDLGMVIDAPNTAVFANTDFWLANNDGATRALLFFEKNFLNGTFPQSTKYVGFRAPDVITTQTLWTLPVADGTSGQVLQTDGAGILSWGSGSGGGGLTNFAEAASDVFPNDVIPAVQLQAHSATGDADFAITPQGAGALITQLPDGTATGGDKRGINAVDLQLSRDDPAEVASGSYSTISGGLDNMAGGGYSAVSGGVFNTAAGTCAFTGGGNTNNASGTYSTVAGGAHNTAYGIASFIGGGGFDGMGYVGNTASGSASTICGGVGNNCSGDYSTILGGSRLSLTGMGSLGFRGNNGSSLSTMVVDASNTTVFANTDLWLANDDGMTRALLFFEQNSTDGPFPNSTKYVGFRAPNAITTQTVWTLPNADGSNGQVLQTDGAGILYWGSASGGGALTGDVSSSGDIVTVNSFNAGTIFGDMASQNAAGVIIAGGTITNTSIDGSPIGSSSPSTGHFSGLQCVTANYDGGGTSDNVYGFMANVGGSSYYNEGVDIFVTNTPSGGMLTGEYLTVFSQNSASSPIGFHSWVSGGVNNTGAKFTAASTSGGSAEGLVLTVSGAGTNKDIIGTNNSWDVSSDGMFTGDGSGLRNIQSSNVSGGAITYETIDNTVTGDGSGLTNISNVSGGAITNETIDGSPIGATVPSTGNFSGMPSLTANYNGQGAADNVFGIMGNFGGSSYYNEGMDLFVTNAASGGMLTGEYLTVLSLNAASQPIGYYSWVSGGVNNTAAEFTAASTSGGTAEGLLLSVSGSGTNKDIVGTNGTWNVSSDGVFTGDGSGLHNVGSPGTELEFAL